MHLFYKQSNGGILGFSHLHVLKLCIILQNLFTYYTSTWSLALPSAKGGKPVVVLRLCRRQRGTKRIIIITILLLSVIMSSPAFAFIVINGIRWCFRRGMKSSRRYEIGFSPGAIRPKHIIYKSLATTPTTAHYNIITQINIVHLRPWAADERVRPRQRKTRCVNGRRRVYDTATAAADTNC